MALFERMPAAEQPAEQKRSSPLEVRAENAKALIKEQFPGYEPEFMSEEQDEKGYAKALLFISPGDPYNPETIFRVPLPDAGAMKEVQKLEPLKADEEGDVFDKMLKRPRGEV